jgi:hypothetical protein
MAVMDGDNIVVGNKTSPPEPAPAAPEKPPHDGPTVCGAMSLQHGDISNLSSPQKFVHLVGCAKTRPPAKR